MQDSPADSDSHHITSIIIREREGKPLSKLVQLPLALYKHFFSLASANFSFAMGAEEWGGHCRPSCYADNCYASKQEGYQGEISVRLGKKEWATSSQKAVTF